MEKKVDIMFEGIVVFSECKKICNKHQMNLSVWEDNNAIVVSGSPDEGILYENKNVYEVLSFLKGYEKGLKTNE